ncbi:MAG TPA: Ig-like domain-containing protein [Methylocystis sp.]|nr:Ig-like domain-containing protein [Methylocystis sp.]
MDLSEIQADLASVGIVEPSSSPATGQSLPNGTESQSLASSDAPGEIYGPPPLYRNAGSGNVTLTGSGAGGDYLVAGSGDDVLLGSGGDETLVGGSGTALLDAGPGSNTLIAGTGPDTFRFDGAFTSDTVQGFNVALDTLEFAASVFQNYAAFAAAASEVDGHLVATDAAGGVITLQGVTLAELQATNFIFDPPPQLQAGNLSTTTTKNAPVTAALPVTDLIAGDTPTYKLVNGPADGAATINANGTFTYDPTGAFPSLGQGATQTESFTYEAVSADGTVTSAPGTITVSVEGQEDPPTAFDQSVSTTAQGAVRVAFDAAEPDTGDKLTYAIVSPPAQGTAAANADGTFTYDPGAAFVSLAPGASQTVTFTYQATDLFGVQSATAAVSIIVYGGYSVAYFLANQAALDAAGGFAIADFAAAVSSNFDALNADANLQAITLIDSGAPVLTLDVNQTLNDTAALAAITNADYAITVQDSAGDVSANIDALNGVSRLSAIELTGSGPLTLTVGQALGDTNALGVLPSCYTAAITDSAANVIANLDALNADSHIVSITLTDAPLAPLMLTVAQALSDARALGEITNAGYTIAIEDSAANIAGALSPIGGSRTTRRRPSTSSPASIRGVAGSTTGWATSTATARATSSGRTARRSRSGRSRTARCCSPSLSIRQRRRATSSKALATTSAPGRATSCGRTRRTARPRSGRCRTAESSRRPTPAPPIRTPGAS